MLHIPKNGDDGLNVPRSFACLPALDNEALDAVRRSHRHAMVQAASTATLVVVVIVLSLL